MRTHATSGRASAALTSRGRRRAHDDRRSCFERVAQALQVARVVEHERVAHVELALDGELGHASPRRAEPALSHTVTASPGSSCSIVTSLGTSARSSSGVPVRTLNVPQWHGTMRFTPSSSTATAASFGPIVK